MSAAEVKSSWLKEQLLKKLLRNIQDKHHKEQWRQKWNIWVVFLNAIFSAIFSTNDCLQKKHMK